MPDPEQTVLHFPGFSNIEPDKDPQRTYRGAFVRSVPLDPSYVAARGGALTRLGTPRLDLLVDSRAVHLMRKSDNATCPVFEMHTGERIKRQSGAFFKSIQSFAEDVWRRVYHRAVPEGNPLEHEDFHRLYRRLQKATERGSATQNVGPAVPNARKQEADRYGRRWRPSEPLKAAAAPSATDPAPFVLCTTETASHAQGSKQETKAVDVWREVEEHVARIESLHRAFTHATTAPDLRGRRYTAHGRRYELKHIREGDTKTASPRYITIGRWREDEVKRSDRSRCSVTIPWIIAEIDGRDKNGHKCRTISDRLARRLLQRLQSLGVCLSDVVVSYSGNASIHIRIPHHLVGCPVYRSSRAAIRSLKSFFDHLCGSDTDLRKAIDDACFRPGQLIRAIGSTNETTGRRVIGATGEEFLHKPSYYLWHLSEPAFHYSTLRLPQPHTGDTCRRLLDLFVKPPKNTDTLTDQDCETVNSTTFSQTPQKHPRRRGKGGLLRRIREGVEEGEPWGAEVGRPECVGRNWATVFWAHHVLDEAHSTAEAHRRLEAWNGRNGPALPRRELDSVFNRVRRWRAERWGQRRAPWRQTQTEAQAEAGTGAEVDADARAGPKPQRAGM